MKLWQVFLFLLVVSGIVQPAAAEDRWNVEIRGGGAVPTQDLGDTALDTGFGFEATVAYRFQPHLAAYAGWDWMHFGASESVDVEETGYAFGLRFVHPLSATSPLRYLVRLGGTYDHIEVENADGDIVADSGHGLGWEAGLGIVVPVGERWELTPGVRYRTLSRDLDSSAGPASVDLSYLALEVGIARSF